MGGYNERYYYSYDLVCRLAINGQTTNMSDILINTGSRMLRYPFQKQSAEKTCRFSAYKPFEITKFLINIHDE